MRQRKVAGGEGGSGNAGDGAAVTSPTNSGSGKKAVPASPTAVNGLRPSPYISEVDFVDSLYQPHTVTAGIVLLSVGLFFFWKWYHLPGDMESSVKMGLVAAAWVFVVFGSIHLPDGTMVRPHPVFWRIVLSVGVLYMCLLVFLLCQELSTVQKLFALYDPSHLLVHPEQSYAEDCRLATPEDPYKFWNTVSDVFLLAHSMGYWAKTLVIRDWRIVTTLSIAFEIAEVTLQHQLPNFKECWWDHLIVDVLICNGGGTLLGMLTLKFFGAKKYHWSRLEDIKTLKGKASRVLTQFTPRSLDRFEWEIFKSPKRFLQVMLVIVVFLVNEINCFLLKNMLNEKPTHHLVVARITLWGFMAIPSMREYYCFVTDKTYKRLGTVAWVGVATLTFESLLIAKMKLEGNHFVNPTPAYIAVPWTVAAALLSLWFVLFFALTSWRRFAVWRFFLNLLFYGAFGVLACMCCMANVDTQWKQKEFTELVAAYGLY